jgi:hypothetical protein
MNWKFKNAAKPQGSSNGFWYDITEGGYIKPEDVLENAAQVKAVKDAIALLIDFENAIINNDLLVEF